jgi:hypothetical protein
MIRKEKTIEPELFEIQLKYWICYVVAYDMVHAIQSLPDYEKVESTISVKQITGNGDGVMNNFYVAKECLPQGLVNKTVDDNKSTT